MQKRIKIHLGDYEELPYIKGIHCRVLIDGCHSYHTNKMPLCVLFHNGYDGNKDIWEPLTVCENPTLLRDTTLNIPLSTFNNLCCFVADNATLLKDFADGTGLQLTDGEDILNESVMPNETSVALLTEMGKLYPKHTGLKGVVWIDQGETYKKGGHFKRIKYDIGGDKDKSISIGLWGRFVPYGVIPDGDKAEVDTVIEWVGHNYDLINKCMDGDISIDTLKCNATRMYKGNAIPRKEQGITKYKDIMNSDYCLIVDISNGLINVAEKVNKNTPLSNVWFEELTGVIPYGGDIHVFGKSSDNDYRFDCQERMIIKLS